METRGLIKTLRAKFEGAIRSFEIKDYNNALKLTSSILSEISDTIEEIEKSYSKTLHENKIPQFKNDLNRLIELSRLSTMGRSEASQFFSLLSRVSTYISVLNGELRRLNPTENYWRKLFRLHRRKVLIGGGVAALVASALVIFLYMASLKHGLVGSYYSNKDLKKIYRKKMDKKIDFNWGFNSPLRNWKKDNFSVRWTGLLRVPHEGLYEFYTHADDGVKLWIDNQLLVDDWKIHKETVSHATMTLTEGYHPIKLEYFDDKRHAVIRLFWKHETSPRATVVTSDFLVPEEKYIDEISPDSDAELETDSEEAEN